MGLLDGLTEELRNPMYENELDMRLAFESDFDAALEKATDKKMKGLSDADIAAILDDSQWQDEEDADAEGADAETTKPGADNFVPGDGAIDEDNALESLLSSLGSSDDDKRSADEIAAECDALLKEAELENDQEEKGEGDGANAKVCPCCGKNPCVCSEEAKANKSLVTVDEPGNNAVVMGDQEGQDKSTTSQAEGDEDSDALEALLNAMEAFENDPVRNSQCDGNPGAVDPDNGDKGQDDKVQTKVSEKDKANSRSTDNLDDTETDDMFTHKVEDESSKSVEDDQDEALENLLSMMDDAEESTKKLFGPNGKFAQAGLKVGKNIQKKKLEKANESDDDSALESLLAALEADDNDPVRHSEDDGNDGVVDPDSGDKNQDNKDQVKVSEKDKANSDSEENLDDSENNDMFTHDVEDQFDKSKEDALESLLSALEADENDPVRNSQCDGNPGVVDPDAGDKKADDKVQVRESEKDASNSEGVDNLDDTKTDDMFTNDVEDQSDPKKDKSDNALEALLNIAMQNV